MKTPIKFLHDCLLIKDTLVIGDLHIGYDEQFHRKAMFPGMMIDNIKEKLDGVFEYLDSNNYKVKRVILLGDVKHDFGKISDIEWRETLYFLDYLKVRVRGGKIVIIKGNHDMILEPIVKKRGILLRDYYKIVVDGKKYCFLHGDKMFKQCLDADWLLFGHVHPAITLADKYKHEKFKCFLIGKWKQENFASQNISGPYKSKDYIRRKNVVVLPSFTDIRYGFNLNNVDDDEYYKDKFFVISNKDLKKFNVVIYNNDEKKEYNFGRLNKLI